MLIQGFIDIATYLLNFIIGLFPVADQNIINGITTNYNTVRNLLATINFMIDIPALFITLGVVISIEALLLLIKSVKWILTNVSFGIFKK